METAKPKNGDYWIEGFPTYGAGLAELRRRGEQPKTIKEIIEARVIAYENGDSDVRDRRLFNYDSDGLGADPLSSCTALISKERSTEFKLVLHSPHLLSLSENFVGQSLRVAYDDVSGDVTLDSRDGKYNQPLREGEPLDHPGWIEVVQDRRLLKAYHDIVFKGFHKKEAMPFYVLENTIFSVMEHLTVGGLNGMYDADDSRVSESMFHLNSYFLFGCPVRKAADQNAAQDLKRMHKS